MKEKYNLNKYLNRFSNEISLKYYQVSQHTKMKEKKKLYMMEPLGIIEESHPS